MSAPNDGVITGLGLVGYPEHADVLRLASRVPCSYVAPSDPLQREVRIRFALPGEGKPGTQVAEVVSRDGAAEVVYPPARGLGPLESRTVALAPAAWSALDSAAGGRSGTAGLLRSIVAEWLGRRTPAGPG